MIPHSVRLIPDGQASGVGGKTRHYQQIWLTKRLSSRPLALIEKAQSTKRPAESSELPFGSVKRVDLVAPAAWPGSEAGARQQLFHGLITGLDSIDCLIIQCAPV